MHRDNESGRTDMTLPKAAPEAPPLTRPLQGWQHWRRQRLDQAVPAAEAQEIVTALLSNLEPALHGAQDPEVQVELAHLVHLLARMPPRMLVQQRVYFEVAFALLAAHPPQLALVRSLRADLDTMPARMAVAGWEPQRVSRKAARPPSAFDAHPAASEAHCRPTSHYACLSPPAFRKPVVPRPSHQETPKSSAYPILSRLSRPR